MFEILILMLDATIRTAPPLILAAMAGMFCERSGVVNIALEGKLLAAAFASAAAAAVSGSAWIGLGAGVGVSILFALMHGFATITHRGDQVVSGMAINILAAGLTVTLGVTGSIRAARPRRCPARPASPPSTCPMPRSCRRACRWPALQRAAERPLPAGVRGVRRRAAGLVGAVPYPLRPAPAGGGRGPAAVDTAGISVVRMRYTALIIGGLLAGIGGTYLAVAQTAQFIPNMSAGKGFMALAALVFGKWRPGTPWRPACCSASSMRSPSGCKGSASAVSRSRYRPSRRCPTS
jgi:simple sugar transport system permease protein